MATNKQIQSSIELKIGNKLPVHGHISFCSSCWYQTRAKDIPGSPILGCVYNWDSKDKEALLYPCAIAKAKHRKLEKEKRNDKKYR